MAWQRQSFVTQSFFLFSVCVGRDRGLWHRCFFSFFFLGFFCTFVRRWSGRERGCGWGENNFCNEKIIFVPLWVDGVVEREVADEETENVVLGNQVHNSVLLQLAGKYFGGVNNSALLHLVSSKCFLLWHKIFSITLWHKIFSITLCYTCFVGLSLHTAGLQAPCAFSFAT